MMNAVPFMSVEDEPRIQEVVKGKTKLSKHIRFPPTKKDIFIEWIANDEVPEYKIFTSEPKAKRNRRHQKYSKESKEAKAIKEKMQKSGESLEQQIMKRQNDRASSMGSFFDKLMEKYGGEDDSDEFDIVAHTKMKKEKKTPAKKVAAANKKSPVHKVKNGRVNKTRSST